MRSHLLWSALVALIVVPLVLGGGCGPHALMEDSDVTVVEALVHAMADALVAGNSEAYTRLVREGASLGEYDPGQVFTDRSFFTYAFSDLVTSRFHDTIQVSATESYCHLKVGMSGQEEVRRFVNMSWVKGDDLQWRLVSRTPREISATAIDVGAPPGAAPAGPICP